MLATGTNKSHVPFTRIASAPSEFVEGFAMPNGVPFKDPSKYSGAEIAKILHLWRSRQKEGIIPFAFSYVVSEGAVSASQYSESMFDGWIWPESTRLPKRDMSPPPNLARHLEAKHVNDSSESSDDAQLPRQAWGIDNSAPATDTEAPEHARGGGPYPKAREHMLSPPPTEHSDAVPTAFVKKHATRNILISDEEHTPEPTMPTDAPLFTAQRRPLLRTAQLPILEEESLASQDESTPKPSRVVPKGKIPMPRKTPRYRQLATPGPSDSATPTTSDIGTPIPQLRGRAAKETPATEVRKSSRLRKPRTRT